MLALACFLIGLGLSWNGTITPAMGAQFGGFIKKKVKEATKQPDSEPTASESSGDSNSPYNDRVLELNEETLAKLEKSLVCEKDYRAEVDAKYAKLPTKDQYERCAMEASMSPEMLQLVQNPGSTPQEAQKVMLNMSSMIEKKCGKNPNEFHKSDDLKLAADKCPSAGSLTKDQYSIARERVLPFCSSGGQNKIKGQGNVYFVYSPAEVSALKPKCDQLRKLIE